MKLPKIVTVFTAKIIYKSGATHEFECFSFSIKGGEYRWDAVSDHNKPIILGVDEIAAIYQTSLRKKLVWS